MKSLRVATQSNLSLDEYQQGLLMEVDSADKDGLMALDNIQLNKAKVAKA